MAKMLSTVDVSESTPSPAATILPFCATWFPRVHGHRPKVVSHHSSTHTHKHKITHLHAHRFQTYASRHCMTAHRKHDRVKRVTHHSARRPVRPLNLQPVRDHTHNRPQHRRSDNCTHPKTAVVGFMDARWHRFHDELSAVASHVFPHLRNRHPSTPNSSGATRCYTITPGDTHHVCHLSVKPAKQDGPCHQGGISSDLSQEARTLHTRRRV